MVDSVVVQTRTTTRTRSCPRPFVPSHTDGPYKLPREAHDRLVAALTPCRNREAAHGLAVFLARFWSAPQRIVRAFPIDRRALIGNQHLSLSESEIRGAIRTLEKIGFLVRDIETKGSRYKATGEGLRRKPILFRFDAEYGVLFIEANHRSERARQRVKTPAVIPSPKGMVRGATQAVISGASNRENWTPANSPKNKNSSKTKVLMGYQNERAAEQNLGLTPLDRALQSLELAIEMGNRVR